MQSSVQEGNTMLTLDTFVNKSLCHMFFLALSMVYNTQWKHVIFGLRQHHVCMFYLLARQSLFFWHVWDLKCVALYSTTYRVDFQNPVVQFWNELSFYITTCATFAEGRTLAGTTTLAYRIVINSTTAEGVLYVLHLKHEASWLLL